MIKWRKLNTNYTTYLSVEPSDAWKIVRGLGATWNVYRAAREGDRYQIIKCVSTLKQAKEFAENWKAEQLIGISE